MTDPAAQLALDVDQQVHVVINEARGATTRDLRLGPISEPDARALVSFLLNRPGEISGDGPWRLAVAGGARTVHLESD